jgi:hypothetical protein
MAITGATGGKIAAEKRDGAMAATLAHATPMIPEANGGWELRAPSSGITPDHCLLCRAARRS